MDQKKTPLQEEMHKIQWSKQSQLYEALQEALWQTCQVPSVAKTAQQIQNTLLSSEGIQA
jgi:hypothetical protein